MGQQRLFRGVTPYLFVAPAVGILVFTCLYPVIKGFELSFYDWSLGTPISSRKYVGWENFAWAWQDPALFNSIKVTLVFTACSVLGRTLPRPRHRLLAREGYPGHRHLPNDLHRSDHDRARGGGTPLAVPVRRQFWPHQLLGSPGGIRTQDLAGNARPGHAGGHRHGHLAVDPLHVHPVSLRVCKACPKIRWKPPRWTGPPAGR